MAAKKKTKTARAPTGKKKAAAVAAAVGATLRVVQVMTRPARTVTADLSVESLAQLLLEEDLRRVPVVDDAGKLLGIVSRSDLAEHLVVENGGEEDWVAPKPRSKKYNAPGFEVRAMPGAAVRDLMSRRVVAAPEQQLVTSCAREMVFHRVHGMPVVDGQGVVVGMVSALDLLQALTGKRVPSAAAGEDTVEQARKARRVLLARRNEIMRRYRRDSRATPTEVEPDLLDRAAIQEGVTLHEGLAQTERRQIEAIDAALRRLAEGHFGKCVACGGAVEAGRLKAYPEAATCRACAEEARASA